MAAPEEPRDSLTASGVPAENPDGRRGPGRPANTRPPPAWPGPPLAVIRESPAWGTRLSPPPAPEGLSSAGKGSRIAGSPPGGPCRPRGVHVLCVRGAFAGYSPDLYSLRVRRFWSAGRPQGTHPHPSGSDRILLPFRFVSFRSVSRHHRVSLARRAERPQNPAKTRVPGGLARIRFFAVSRPFGRRPGPEASGRFAESAPGSASRASVCAPRSRRVFGSHARGDGALARRNRFAVSWFASRPHGLARGAWARRGFPRFARASRFPVFFP